MQLDLFIAYEYVTLAISIGWPETLVGSPHNIFVVSKGSKEWLNLYAKIYTEMKSTLRRACNFSSLQGIITNIMCWILHCNASCILIKTYMLQQYM